MEVSVSGFPLPRRATVAGQPTADSAAAKLGEDKALTARMGTEPACWTPTLQRRARQRPFGDSHSPLSILWTDGTEPRQGKWKPNSNHRLVLRVALRRGGSAMTAHKSATQPEAVRDERLLSRHNLQAAALLAVLIAANYVVFRKV